MHSEFTQFIFAMTKRNIGDMLLPTWKIFKKHTQTEAATITNTTETPVSVTQVSVEKVPEPTAVQETFKEHYPLLFPYSYAAIVEDEKNELKYSVLEPTLTPIDESWIKELKSILWDELFINTKDFKEKQEAEAFLKYRISLTPKKYKIQIDENTLAKYQYFISRDFLHFGKIDGLMGAEN